MSYVYCSTFSEQHSDQSDGCFVFLSVCSHLTSEMTKCRGELLYKDSELHRLRKDVVVKASQISRMEESLQHARSQLHSKSDTGMSLPVSYFTFAETTEARTARLWFKNP